MIVERRCIQCDRIRPMYHNACRCYECALKHRNTMDHIRFESRKKSKLKHRGFRVYQLFLMCFFYLWVSFY
jgi:hypothetical protein